MKTIEINTKSEITIKNSLFICYIFKINTKEEFNNHLKELKEKYNDATHHCYAYILENDYKSSDDGEPGGTAGNPILNVLKNNDLINTCAIVIRYFGGIKLGPGGLIRAYTKVTQEALSKTKLSELEKGINVDIFFEYNKVTEIDYLLKNVIINNKEFNELIKYNINITENILNIIKDKLIKYNINSSLYIEKK